MIRAGRRVWHEARAGAVAGGFVVELDGRAIRLTDGGTLRVATRRLAEAIAAEWARPDPGKAFGPQDIPLTRIAGTAQTRIAPDPGSMIARLSAFGATDLICYRAAKPEALVRREETLWQPWIDWARTELGAALSVTKGVMPVAQAAAPLASLSRAVAACDVPALAALGNIVPALGSLVLGLAVVHERIGAAAAADCAFADEIFQAELWGEDKAQTARRADISAEIAVAEQFMALARA